ncbi:hypothetical protein QYF36_008889 [Acer negundo]|nr:hypothetical protein QYF36_008889 [Acer negundo]
MSNRVSVMLTKVKEKDQSIESARYLLLLSAEATLNANVVKRFVEENQRLAEECSQWKREYESVYEALLELENKADERNKKAQVRIHDLEAKLSEVSYVLYFYKQQYQTLGRLFEENFRLTEEYRRLLNVCLLYDQDCQALMKIGNEADEKAKEAKTRVHDLEVQLDQVLDELNFYKLQYHYSKLSGLSVENCRPKNVEVAIRAKWEKFKYVVRPVLPSGCGAVGATDSLNLGGYGVELALKNIVYKARDDSMTHATSFILI